VAAWEEQFLRFMREQMPEVRNTLRKDKKLSKDLEEQLKKAIEYFHPQFKKPE
jgi:F-type H+-transporting ATPase subunit alpha